jgi:hypothetical protein
VEVYGSVRKEGRDVEWRKTKGKEEEMDEMYR